MAMVLLLITGAGASRNLGGEEPMPLMRDWCDALCTALDERESNLAAACYLSPGMDGPEFENNLGLLLRWQQVRYLDERFQGLGGPNAGTHNGAAIDIRGNIDRRMAVIMETINVTLYEQFGQHRIDDTKAASVYKKLLKALGDPELIVATTNYDRAVVAALQSLGHQVDTGFPQLPARTPVLDPTDLVANRKQKTPVIHLHGAVGWYERDGLVRDHYADQPYNPSLGAPVVLYPDPEKDPTNDAIVSQLWTELNAALDVADAVLVVGHSLHDPALVRALNEVAGQKPVVVSFYWAEDDGVAEDKVPGAIGVYMDFGPTLKADDDLRSRVEKGQRPAVVKTR